MNKIICFCFLFFLNGTGFTMEIELPQYLKRLGLANPKDFTAYRELDHPHPILSYQLDKDSIAEMNLQYQVAIQAKEKGHNEIALKIIWDLAERGCGSANHHLAGAFMHKKLGLKQDYKLASIFLQRPYTMDAMIKEQLLMQHSWDNSEAIKEEIMQTSVFLRASYQEKELLNTKAHNDSFCDTTLCSSENSADSVFSPMFDNIDDYTHSTLATLPSSSGSVGFPKISYAKALHPLKSRNKWLSRISDGSSLCESLISSQIEE